VLMSPQDSAVDHRVFVIAVGCQVLKDALPYAGFGPAAEPSVRILPVAKALRQVAAWYSGTEPVQYRLDKATIVAGGCTDVAQLVGKQVLDPFPLIVPKSIAGSCVSLRQSRLCMIHINFCSGRLLFTAYHPDQDSCYVCPCSN
jgi:hypothetical protein